MANKPAPALPLRDGGQAMTWEGGVFECYNSRGSAAGEDRVAGLPGSRECVDL